MRVHRITAEVYGKTAVQAFSGQGGILGMGRWHTRGRPIVYCAQHQSLSALEALVHIQRSDCIQLYVRWKMDIPDKFITMPNDLPADWKMDIMATRAYGDAWLAGKKTPVLRVPSVHGDTEFNFLLNPAHPDFDLGWVTAGPIPSVFDPRLTTP